MEKKRSTEWSCRVGVVLIKTGELKDREKSRRLAGRATDK